MRERAIRFPRRVQVRFWPESAPESSYAGYSRNISASGMFIATIHPMKPGSRLAIEMQNEGKSFVVKGKVMHSAKVSALLQSVRPSGMGVRFTGRSAGIEKLLPADEIQPIEDERPVYPIFFCSATELVEIYDRDMKNGGVFVPTSRPAAIDQEISVELNLPRDGDSVITLVAKVVHRVASGPEIGMGVAFSDQQEVTERVGAIVDQMRAR